MRGFWVQLKKTANTLTVRLVFYGFLAVIFWHWLLVMQRYWGRDVSVLYEAMKLRLMQDTENGAVIRLVQLFPFLVVIPAGFSYLDDVNNDTDLYVRSRTGNRNYVRSKLFAAFVVSFLVYWLPFILELLLLIAGFGTKVTGDPSNISDYDPAMQTMIRHYLFSALYEKHPVWYAVLEVTMWAVTVGAVGCFSVCLSMYGIKWRALLFVPVFALAYVLGILGDFLGLSFTTNYMTYMFSYNGQSKSDPAIWLFNIGILIVCAILGFVAEKRDRL